MKGWGRYFKFLNLLIIFVMIFSSCVQNSGLRAKKVLNGTNLTGNGSTGGQNAVDNGSTSTDPSTLMSQKVELSHLVDPFDGTYKKKVTIPKNFKGNLYLAGLNVSALSDKLVYVRFRFGVEGQSVVLPATVARAPGIIPKTEIQVLVVDMTRKPFANMRLGYDLYDYNDYTDTAKEPVTDPRDGGLYCRGLRLDDDPTYIPTVVTASCSSITDKCLYSYAKILDTTLYDSSSYTSVPTRPQVWSTSTGTRSPSITTAAAGSCLPDYPDVGPVNTYFELSPGLAGLVYDLTTYSTYKYRGPYRSINDSEWQITSGALFNSTYGLFKTQSAATNTNTGFQSFLFPIAGTIKLSAGVYYMGSTDRFGQRGILTSDSTGTSKYVDGCNLRVMNYDPSTNESISSCNVNGSIELYYLKDGKEVSITTDKTIKLQLIRASLTNYEGKEVLTNSFKRCESSTTCGSDECCFNSRCWSKELVTQCVDQTPVVGNQEIGTSCTSDLECSSLCCNQSTGVCAAHNPNGASPSYCGKSPGQQCVSKEFCKQEPVTTCKVVKSGFKPDGTVACTLRCPAVMTYGDCKAGYCVPPTQPAVPPYDPNDCSNAVDP